MAAVAPDDRRSSVDGYHFDVDADNPANAGSRSSGLVSPKGGAIFGPWRSTEFYVNGGFGFHSNDARGSTITVDPSTGEPAERVTPLVRAKGAEVGFRTIAIPRLQSTVALWRLDIDSELLFVGDAGTTEASRPSRRYGIEWTNFARLSPTVTADADLAWSRARFTDNDPAGAFIPGAAEVIASLGLTVDRRSGLFGSARLRYFGGRPLIEDDTVRSKSDQPRQRPARLPPDAADARRARSVQRLQLGRERHRLLLCLAAARRARRRGRLHTHPTLPRSARLVFE